MLLHYGQLYIFWKLVPVPLISLWSCKHITYYSNFDHTIYTKIGKPKPLEKRFFEQNFLISQNVF